MKVFCRAFVFLAVFVFTTARCCSQHTVIVPYTAEEINTKGMEKEILTYINDYRKTLNKPAFIMTTIISAEAVAHSVDMAAKKVPFGHDGFKQRVSNINKSAGFVHAAAENVASGKMNAKQVVDGWLNSPPHKLNIEGDYTLTGIGLAKDETGAVYFTELFIRL